MALVCKIQDPLYTIKSVSERKARTAMQSTDMAENGTAAVDGGVDKAGRGRHHRHLGLRPELEADDRAFHFCASGNMYK